MSFPFIQLTISVIFFSVGKRNSHILHLLIWLYILHVVRAYIYNHYSLFSSQLRVRCLSWKLGIEWRPLWYTWVESCCKCLMSLTAARGSCFCFSKAVIKDTGQASASVLQDFGTTCLRKSDQIWPHCLDFTFIDVRSWNKLKPNSIFHLWLPFNRLLLFCSVHMNESNVKILVKFDSD